MKISSLLNPRFYKYPGETFVSNKSRDKYNHKALLAETISFSEWSNTIGPLLVFFALYLVVLFGWLIYSYTLVFHNNEPSSRASGYSNNRATSLSLAKSSLHRVIINHNNNNQAPPPPEKYKAVTMNKGNREAQQQLLEQQLQRQKRGDVYQLYVPPRRNRVVPGYSSENGKSDKNDVALQQEPKAPANIMTRKKNLRLGSNNLQDVATDQ